MCDDNNCRKTVSVSQWETNDVAAFLRNVSGGSKWEALAKCAESSQISGVELASNAESPDMLVELFADASPAPTRPMMRTVITLLRKLSGKQQNEKSNGNHNSFDLPLPTHVDLGNINNLNDNNSSSSSTCCFPNDDDPFSIEPITTTRNASGAALEIATTIGDSQSLDVVLQAMQNHPKSGAIQEAASQALKRLVSDDDVAKAEAETYGAVMLSLQTMRLFPQNVPVLVAAAEALGALVYDHQPNQVALISGLPILVNFLKSTSSPEVARALCDTMVNATYDNPDAQAALAQAKGFQVLLLILNRFVENSTVVESACHTLGNLLMDSRSNQINALAAAAAGPSGNTCCPTLMCNLISMLRKHQNKTRVIEIVCSTLEILLAVDEQHGRRGVAPAAVEAGVVDALIPIIKKYTPDMEKTSTQEDKSTIEDSDDEDDKSTGSLGGNNDDNKGDDTFEIRSKRIRTKRSRDDGEINEPDDFGGSNVVAVACRVIKYLAADSNSEQSVVHAGAVPSLLAVVSSFSLSAEVTTVSAVPVCMMFFCHASLNCVFMVFVACLKLNVLSLVSLCPLECHLGAPQLFVVGRALRPLRGVRWLTGAPRTIDWSIVEKR